MKNSHRIVLSTLLVWGCGGDLREATEGGGPGRPPPAPGRERPTFGAEMSDAGQLAAELLSARRIEGGRASLSRACFNVRKCRSRGFRDDPAGTQSEVSIAADPSGRHVVIGFNDFRGFDSDPPSVSGFYHSHDGGRTFTDGGQLPATGAGVQAVVGDPDVKSLGGCDFVFSSILVANDLQTMSVHRSRDCGRTWQGPFEVTAASDPAGAADKEFLDVDDSGRVLMSWTHFTATGAEISTTFSDDVLSATPPTWSVRKVVANGDSDGQGSVPHFAGRGSPNAYVAWSRFPFPGTFNGNGNTIGFARSTDNGATWSAPVDLSGEFFTMDQVLGNDRVHNFPSLAVDRSHGHHRGSIYVVYANNDSRDGADVVLQRSRDGGQSFSPALLLNSRPGADRAQFFPVVTVDSLTGRVYVFYYDQGIARSGDLTEVTFTFSDDGGVHFSAPAPLTERPFHAGWGNDSSQPNLGDYNGGTALRGELFAGYALTRRPPAGFADGQPGGQLTPPNPAFRRVRGGFFDPDGTNTAPLSLDGASFADSGRDGHINANELVGLKLRLRNYVQNPLNARRLVLLHGQLSTSTPGVQVVQRHGLYPSLDAGATGTNGVDYVLRTLPGFVAGTPIELELHVHTLLQGSATLRHTLFTGTPTATTLLAENFEAAAPGALPAGWSAVHLAGDNTVPWRTRAGFCGRSKSAFHANAADGPPMGSAARIERLFSPVVRVPARSDYVQLEFDVCFNTEFDPSFAVLGYDGFFLRITDLTTGRTTRSVLAEAFADEFQTGAEQHYPKHFPRGGGAYFEDMSAWSGASGGAKRVRLRLPGMAGSTVQLRFEYTQDDIFTCTDVGLPGDCGVSVDNLVMKNVVINR